MGFPLRKTVRIGVTNRPAGKAPPNFEALLESFYAGYHGTVSEDDVPRGMCQWAFRMGRRQRGKP